MLDGLLALTAQLHKPVFDEKYSADQAITKATLYENPRSHKLVVVFLPWHVPAWYATHLQASLALLPQSVLIYTFNDAIIQTDLVRVKSSFEFIALAVASDIEHLRSEKGYTTVDLLGISLGNVSLCIAAEKIRHFNKVVMLAPGNTLAGALWNGWRTRRLRDYYKKQGLTVVDLQKEWDIIAPAAHVKRLRGHNIQIILARKDRFIPYRYGRELVRDLLDAHAKVIFTEKPLGHAATILSYKP